jgi:small ubiquitin-related modifier
LLHFTLADQWSHAVCICAALGLQTGEETFFKIKRTTKMSKVFETYASRKGVQVASLRFLLDGERIQPDQTPKMLELDDQDQIDCVLEQTGGN